jgi:hypothetical protein
MTILLLLTHATHFLDQYSADDINISASRKLSKERRKLLLPKKQPPSPPPVNDRCFDPASPKAREPKKCFLGVGVLIKDEAPFIEEWVKFN